LEAGAEPLAEVRITEGRYHQVKRMFGVLDRGVNLLKRVAIGDVRLDPSLNEGECRYLTENECKLLGI